MNLFGKLGRLLISKISILAGLLSLIFYSFMHFFKPGAKGREYVYAITLTQIYFTGVQAVTLISIIAFFIGSSLIFAFSTLSGGLFDLSSYIGLFIDYAIIKILGPLLTTIIIIARSGTAISTEIATMVIRHETEALETMGVDTLLYIVLPRIIGMIVSIFYLTLYFYVIAILGGVGVAAIMDESFSSRDFFTSFFDSLTWMHVIELFVKSIFFGAGISVICTINGFKVLLYPGGVPFAGIKGVVGSLIYVFFIFGALTVLFIL